MANFRRNPTPLPDLDSGETLIGSFGQHKSVEGNAEINVFIKLDGNFFKDF